MQIEGNSHEAYSPGKLFKHFEATPSTDHKSIGNESGQIQPEVQEFSLDYDMMSLNKLMSQSSLNDKQNQKHITDRFIPIRKSASLRVQNFNDDLLKIPEKKTKRGEEIGESKVTIDQLYKMMLLGESNKKLFSFADSNNKIGKSQNIFKEKSDRIFNSKNIPKKSNDLSNRKINKTPFKVLDAPNLQDDFYLNLLEWSPSNILSVALDSSLYLWNANNNKVIRFCDLNPRSITSLTWNSEGSQICIGNNEGTSEIWDLEKNIKMFEMFCHAGRVSSLAWNGNKLASGSRDRKIHLRDIRQNSRSVVETYHGHSQEVCGLKWSHDGQLLASGGNDNKLFVWNIHTNIPVNKFTQHCAAVKGLAWNPHNHGILASGGGSADRSIKFWNTLDGSLLDSIDTGSQVCNLTFSKTTREFVSTHGYSNNEIIVWKYPTLEKVTTLTGHTSRVLYLAMNPSGDTIVTGAGDETLRFWNVFPLTKQLGQKNNLLSTLELR